MYTTKISVRSLVEFILRSGSITSSSGIKDPDAMQEGVRIHKMLQRKMGAGYNAEVALSVTLPVTYGGTSFELTVEGRADGIFIDETGVNIDEIKGVYNDISIMEEPVAVHRAQALCYAYIYSSGHKLEQIGVRMTYCHIPTENVRYFNEIIGYGSLEDWFNQLINEYAKWVSWQIEWHKKRNASIQGSEFPFEYREGQNNIVKGVYQSILRKKRLYIEAPTGVGKTISVLFPAAKSMGEGITEKIFYLTAKTITRTVAEETYQILSGNGMALKNITITAKEKICILDRPQCHPSTCGRALGHYDRVNDAVFDIITHEDNISREVITRYAEKHNVCPFEMCLDTAMWADAVTGDYNYVFDPSASLKRFFANQAQNNYVFLIDEAHNLVDRAREMYSAELIKEDFLDVKKITKSLSKKITNALEHCNQCLLKLKRECDDVKKYEVNDIEEFILKLMRLSAVFDEYFQKQSASVNPVKPEIREKLLDFYFKVYGFLSIYEILDSKYIIYSDYTDNGFFCLHLKCMDPSGNLDNCLSRGTAAVFFSATLLPVRYYMEQLAGRADDYAIYAPSPFPVDNRLLMVASDISTKYTRRTPSEYKKFAGYIYDFISAKTGNYMVFFPSYKMMEDITWHLEDYLHLSGYTQYDTGNYIDSHDSKICLCRQDMSMDEQEREDFLLKFTDNPDYTTIGLCIMGGIFGEGIDLKYNRLIGTVIVGTGLPMVCTENELFREYFDEEKGAGFSYAYQYPGMNKVLQAAGRVIRTSTDKGAILLLDERFLKQEYIELFPREWYPYNIVNRNYMGTCIRGFWNNQK
ncbi:MAG: ATP-dependent DNA helicase [Lachnospiraceae bacterium]|nr:ATP-dependent DNA helicase [Lachnospiraceae bacterium]